MRPPGLAGRRPRCTQVPRPAHGLTLVAILSPALEWRNPPPGTRSFALLMHDQDAPTGSGFWHWAVYNIPLSATGLGRGAGNTPAALPPPAVGGVTDFHDTGVTGGNGNYGGPCPPLSERPHRYVFTLYTLAAQDIHQAAGIPRSGTPALHAFAFALNKALGALMLEKVSQVATFGRQPRSGLRNKLTSLDPGTGSTVRAAWFPT